MSKRGAKLHVVQHRSPVSPQHAVAGTLSISAHCKYSEWPLLTDTVAGPRISRRGENQIIKTVVRSELVRAVLLKIHVFWDVAPCPLVIS